MRIITRSLLLLAAVLCVYGQQDTGYLKTKVRPSRAGVFIDGKYVGPAGNFAKARTYAVAPGEHEIRLSEPRYEDLVTKVSIEAGRTTKLDETMKPVPLAQPPFGLLRTISGDKFAPVYVNGKYMGHADEFNNPFQGLKLNPGEYLVKVGDGQEERIEIVQNQTTIVRAK